MTFRQLSLAGLSALICSACCTLPEPADVRFEGEVSLYSDGHVLSAVMQLADGGCVNLSLPDRLLNLMEHGETYDMHLLGRLYDYQAEAGSMIFVNGRRMPYPTCDRILFVE